MALFAGIGGLSKAIEEYARPVVYCEIDRYCQAVLFSHMADGSLPSAPIIPDVKTITADEIKHLIGVIQIITGGFPCQDISLAGKGSAGESLVRSERSGLFFEIIRIARILRPKYIFLENVPAITTRGGLEVLGALTELGYDCRWTLVSAAELGAKHRRQRWFLLAHTQSKRRREERELRCDEPEKRATSSGKNVANPDCIRWRQDSENCTGSVKRGREKRLSPRLKHCGQVVANSMCKGLPVRHERGKSQKENEEPQGSEFSRTITEGARQWQIEPDVGRMADGVPNRVDRIKGLGNAVVPLQAREAFERLIGLHGHSR